MSQVTLPRAISRIGLLQIAILVLAVATALIHLDRAFMTGAFGGHAGGFGGPGVPGGHARGFGGPGGPGRPGGPPPGGGMGILAPILMLIPLPTLFLLDSLAYIILAGALYLPPLRQFQSVIRWLLIILAVGTIIAWFLLTGARYNLLGYIDKPVEVALIVLLLVEAWQARKQRTQVG